MVIELHVRVFNKKKNPYIQGTILLYTVIDVSITSMVQCIYMCTHYCSMLTCSCTCTCLSMFMHVCHVANLQYVQYVENSVSQALGFLPHIYICILYMYMHKAYIHSYEYMDKYVYSTCVFCMLYMHTNVFVTDNW